jgi:hypothetical protein
LLIPDFIVNESFILKLKNLKLIPQKLLFTGLEISTGAFAKNSSNETRCIFSCKELEVLNEPLRAFYIS